MGKLEGKVSLEDRQRVNDLRNPPQYEQGFEGTSENDDFNMDDLFGTSSDTGSDTSDPFGASNGLDDVFGSSSNSNNGAFGSSSNGGNDVFGTVNQGQSGNVFGAQAQGTNSFGMGIGTPGFSSPFAAQPMQVEAKPDRMDKMLDAGAEAAKGLGKIIIEMFKSIKLRTADDFGYLSRNSILAGVVLGAVGVVSGIIGQITGIKFLSFAGLGMQVIIAGICMFGSGMIGLGTSALILEKVGRKNSGSIDNLSDLSSSNDNFTGDYEDNIDDELDELFSEEEMNELFGESEDTDTSNFGSQDVDNDELFNPEAYSAPETIDYNSKLENVRENQYVCRELLFNTFKPMFPKCTPQFSEKRELDSSSEQFEILETICLKALANIANCQLEEVNSSLETAYESFFSYELRLKRINKVKKTDDLAREIEAYMRDSSDDDSINATVDIEGDFYKILVTKGVTAVVTFGDIFTQDYCCEFYLNTKNKLPMIVGIDELGKVLVDDAKNFDTMLIAGKPRSGKSWTVLSVLMSLMLFNSPEDVQFCIVDPKESNLFKTIALMPHVFGLHNDEKILDILEDIIEIEAPRRKKLLSDNRCDDIWALRKKGIKLPVLYVVIDEYITVVNNLDKDGQKEFDNKIQILISQLPFEGIRLILVPHRATGIVNKTNRTMLSYTAAVRADTADVIDTLGIQKWNRALTMPGDIAVKTANMKNAIYVRGAALTSDDGENTLFIENAAKVFYKMGVDIPDMSNMRVAYNRDEEYIKQELGGAANRVQFNIDNLDSEVDNMNFSNI